MTVNAHRLAQLQPDRGGRQHLKVMQLLAAVEGDGATPLAEALVASVPRIRRGMTAVVITASLDRDWVKPLAALRSRGVACVVVSLDSRAFERRAARRRRRAAGVPAAEAPPAAGDGDRPAVARAAPRPRRVRHHRLPRRADRRRSPRRSPRDRRRRDRAGRARPAARAAGSPLRPAEGWLTPVRDGGHGRGRSPTRSSRPAGRRSLRQTGFLPWVALIGLAFGVIGAKIGWGRWRTHLVGALHSRGLLLPLVVGGIVLGDDIGWDPHGLAAAPGGGARRHAQRLDRPRRLRRVRSRPSIAHYHLVFGVARLGRRACSPGFTVFGHRRPLDAVVVLGLALLANMALTAARPAVPAGRVQRCGAAPPDPDARVRGGGRPGRGARSATRRVVGQLYLIAAGGRS